MHPFRAISLLTASSLLFFGVTPALAQTAPSMTDAASSTAATPSHDEGGSCRPEATARVEGLHDVRVTVTIKGFFTDTTSEASSESSPEPTVSPEPTPTSEPSPEPTASPSPTSTSAAVVEPTESPAPQPSVTNEPSVRAGVAPRTTSRADASAMLPTVCPRHHVNILVTNVTTGRVLADEDKGRDWVVLQTTWKETFKVGPGETVKVLVRYGSAESTADATTPNVPGTPQNFVAEPINPRSATLRWTAPTHDGGRRVTHYEVGPPGHTHRVDGHTWQAEGLEPDTDYTFVVAALNDVGRSDFVSYTLHTPIEPKKPTEPRDFKAHNDTAFSMDLDWTPPRDAGGLPIDGYLVTWQAGSQGGERFTTQTSMAVRGLVPSTKYTFTVLARNSQGDSPRATVKAKTAKPQPRPEPEPPSEPRSVEQAGGSYTSVKIGWERPEFAGNGTYLKYTVSWKGNTKETSDTSFVIEGLPKNTPVDVSVWAFNEAGRSDAVAITAYPTMDPVKPTAPQPPLNPGVTSLGGPSAADQSLLVEWDEPSFDGRSPVTGYDVHWAPTSDPTHGRTDSVTGTSFVASGLPAATEYSFSIVAKNAIGSSSPAEISGWTNLVPIVDRVPAEPTDVQRLSGSTTELVMAWTPPAYTGSGPLLGYLVEWSEPGVPGIRAAMTVEPEAVLTGLTPGTAYTVDVMARNAAGMSPAASATVRTNMEPIVPQAPSEPRKLAATGSTTTSIALTWQAPASAGDAPVTGYAVRVPGQGPVVVDATTALVAGLVPDRQYTIEVTALNVFGESPAASVTARTAAAPPGPGPAPGPTPAPVPFTPDKPGTNTDGSLDLDLRERTIRQTLPGKWPARLTVLSGEAVTIAPAKGMITNADQTATIRPTYRSSQISKVMITRDPKTKAYVMRAYLKHGKASGVVVVTITAPAVTKDGKKYEALQISQRFLVKSKARR